MKKTFNLLKEPTGTIYYQLLSYAQKYCESFLMVIRDTVQKSDSIKKIIDDLQPYILEKDEKSEWPGTILHRGTATVTKYKLNNETLKLLASAVNGLYSWKQPDFPEDLCFLRQDGSPWLVTITYEEDGYLELTDKESEDLHQVIPGLALEEQAVNESNK
jgi:hypothetical protein